MPWFAVEVATTFFDVALVEADTPELARKRAMNEDVTYKGLQYIEVETHQVREVAAANPEC